MCPVGKGRQVGWPIDSLARRAGVGSMPSHRPTSATSPERKLGKECATRSPSSSQAVKDNSSGVSTTRVTDELDMRGALPNESAPLERSPAPSMGALAERVLDSALVAWGADALARGISPVSVTLASPHCDVAADVVTATINSTGIRKLRVTYVGEARRQSPIALARFVLGARTVPRDCKRDGVPDEATWPRRTAALDLRLIRRSIATYLRSHCQVDAAHIRLPCLGNADCRHCHGEDGCLVGTSRELSKSGLDSYPKGQRGGVDLPPADGSEGTGRSRMSAQPVATPAGARLLLVPMEPTLPQCTHRALARPVPPMCSLTVRFASELKLVLESSRTIFSATACDAGPTPISAAGTG
eukprot:scaffold240353_cov27-Tisochrysis_lutea.AAC.2